MLFHHRDVHATILQHGLMPEAVTYISIYGCEKPRLRSTDKSLEKRQTAASILKGFVC